MLSGRNWPAPRQAQHRVAGQSRLACAAGHLPHCAAFRFRGLGSPTTLLAPHRPVSSWVWRVGGHRAGHPAGAWHRAPAQLHVLGCLSSTQGHCVHTAHGGVVGSQQPKLALSVGALTFALLNPGKPVVTRYCGSGSTRPSHRSRQAPPDSWLPLPRRRSHPRRAAVLTNLVTLPCSAGSWQTGSQP